MFVLILLLLAARARSTPPFSASQISGFPTHVRAAPSLRSHPPVGLSRSSRRCVSLIVIAPCYNFSSALSPRRRRRAGYAGHVWRKLAYQVGNQVSDHAHLRPGCLAFSYFSCLAAFTIPLRRPALHSLTSPPSSRCSFRSFLSLLGDPAVSVRIVATRLRFPPIHGWPYLPPSLRLATSSTLLVRRVQVHQIPISRRLLVPGGRGGAGATSGRCVSRIYPLRRTGVVRLQEWRHGARSVGHLRAPGSRLLVCCAAGMWVQFQRGLGGFWYICAVWEGVWGWIHGL